MSIEELLRNTQIKGNIGLYYVCYQLSLRGWNVMPTARNAKGPDLLIYSEDATRTRTIQVKMVSGITSVGLGNSNHVFGNFLIIVRQWPSGSTPECFVLTTKEVSRLARRSKKGGKFWLSPRDYDTKKFRERWKLIGSGLKPCITFPPRTPKKVTFG